MEIKLDELINKIKEDGIQTANNQANDIIENAKKEAEKIISDAKKEAEKIILSGEANVKKVVDSGNASLKQASRDLILGLKKSIENIFDKIILKNVTTSYDDAILKEMIPYVVKSIVEKDGDLSIFLNQDSFNKLNDYLKNRLNQDIKNDLIIKPSESVDAGFKLSIDNGKAFYDFSDRKIAELLSIYVNKNLKKILEDRE